MKNEELLILVDENDKETGLKEKLSVHRDGDLHRALSVFIFDPTGKMLLQRRALEKYHSGGLWTNACCSHPKPEEPVKTAAVRRLKEEMGLRCDNLQRSFSFKYKAQVDHGLIEHEFDHVFIGVTDQKPQPNPAEVCEYSYLSLSEIEKDLQLHPEKYTVWFKLIFDRIRDIRK